MAVGTLLAASGQMMDLFPLPSWLDLISVTSRLTGSITVGDHGLKKVRADPETGRRRGILQAR